MFCTTIDKYLCLRIGDLKRLGFLVPAATCTGSVEWKQGGRPVASVGLYTKTTGVPVARFAYDYNGEPVTYDVALRWKRSNLNADTPHGYYYFVCPVTGSLCRNLYLVDGRFVGRKAFNALYPGQAESRKQRGYYRYWRTLLAAGDIQADRYRRETYRGRLTPYGRKVEKLARSVALLTGDEPPRRTA